MTSVYLTNADNSIQSTKYYIEIIANKIETDCTPTIATTLQRPKSPINQGSDSITTFIDLQQRTKIITIYGYIDKYSNRASNWAANAVHDAGVVKQRLERMYDRGGANKLYVGTAADGYYNITNSGVANYIMVGLITKMKITESDTDHIDRISNSEDYPSATRKIADKYDVIITIQEGATRGQT